MASVAFDIFYIFEDIILLASSLWVVGTVLTSLVYIIKVWLPAYLEHRRDK